MRQPLSSAWPETGHQPPESPAPVARAPVVERIGGWSARHRKTTVLGWLLLIAVVIVAGHSLPAKTVRAYDAGQSGQAERALNQFGRNSHPAESVLVEARAGRTFGTDPALRQATQQVVTALRDLPGSAAGIHSPFSPGGASLVSANGRAALVTFTIPGKIINPGQALGEDQTVTADLNAVAAVQSRHPGLIITEAGDASEDKAINGLLNSDFSRAEVTSVPITLILLLGVFGALIAAGIPLLLALTSVAAALALLSIPGQWLPVGQNTREVVLLIGTAVGVDYSLFYLRRAREERAQGATIAQAIRTAAATSGRTIVVSGLTVMTALAGLFLTGYSGFTGIAIGTIAVVGIAVIGSLTLLPALLSWLGQWADRGRVPFLGRRRTAARPSRVWAALARRVVRRPLLWGGAAAIAMLALAAPALGMRLTNPATDVPNSTPIVQSFNAIQRAFPHAPTPAQVIVTGTGLTSPQLRAAVTALQGRATASGPIRGPITATPIGGGRALMIDVPLAGNGSNTTSNDALTSLRSNILPTTLGKVSGIRYAVGGETAGSYDDTKALDARTPLVLGVVAVLAFLVLLISFRSITLPLVSSASTCCRSVPPTA